mmetsp:Transcript_30057/g.44548  ORF Transcript_30057/g.44548 Transcript_30057/m.44548 type:complete len:396 (+) Transcript_30057:286-1473(+)|eukprot:CAMPEP_0195520522 /NCGR_PEP_ID=MMETSP0794_2-20130614/17091_1 /TAXON_ID=515487 /ORGANISM="Stephanopyxis turris, Strain CCMP 815" /LENGTH=395 /DNA_ID=CAMNT_0040649899 /DNA_START=286 /DNA_END=1473 /DNA_ORIENTATION=-
MSKSPSLRRIQADIRELSIDPSDRYHAAPLEDDMFEWHFTIRGADGTDFEGGIYHGRILLPTDYPFKPPHIVFLTPSGRFETGVKVCLSFSAHHPELWQPAWGIRLILEALISFLPTPADGAIGALDWTSAERKRLAKKSLDYFCPKCGLVADLLPELGSTKKKNASGNKFQEEIAKLHAHQIKNEQGNKGDKSNITESVPAETDVEVKDIDISGGSALASMEAASETTSLSEPVIVAKNGQRNCDNNCDEESKILPTPISSCDEQAEKVLEAFAHQPPHVMEADNVEGIAITSSDCDHRPSNISEERPEDAELQSGTTNQLDEPVDTSPAHNIVQQIDHGDRRQVRISHGQNEILPSWFTDPVAHASFAVFSVILVLLYRKIQTLLLELEELES